MVKANFDGRYPAIMCRLESRLDHQHLDMVYHSHLPDGLTGAVTDRDIAADDPTTTGDTW